MADFVAVDVETANHDLASICQIAAVAFSAGEVSDTWASLVDPDDYFDPVNVEIHGIDASSVRGAPRFEQVLGELTRRVAGQIVAIHTTFDRSAIQQACRMCDAPMPDCRWLDTAKVCRRTWTQFSRKGYGLENVAGELGIKFRHHDAAEDARTAGRILVRAMADTGEPVEALLARSLKPISERSPIAIAREGNEEGALFGEVVVFTGALTMLRHEAAALAAEAGCTVRDGVTKKTTLLVVGQQDLRRIDSAGKSSKHQKVERMIQDGQSIRILGEEDFVSLVKE